MIGKTNKCCSSLDSTIMNWRSKWCILFRFFFFFTIYWISHWNLEDYIVVWTSPQCNSVHQKKNCYFRGKK